MNSFCFDENNEDQPNDCQQIEKMKQQHSWNNGNIEEFMSFYWNNDSLMFIAKNVFQYGWQTTLDNYKINKKTIFHQSSLHGYR